MQQPSPPTRHGSDTICAIATPPGMGGIGIVRISGPRAGALTTDLLGELPAPRVARFTSFLNSDGEAIDSGLALWFPGPHSFTGEDVLELQGHGGPTVLHLLVERLVAMGCRQARPGEFSERAFLNDKMDLAQAEAIADLIASGTAVAARAARRSMDGLFSAEVSALQAQLTQLRVFVEAAIDFPDEEIDFLAESDVDERLNQARSGLSDLLSKARQGRLLRDGMTLAIIGKPNAGKSSVLNALTGHDTAIVTEVPGTTRDVLKEQIEISGVPIHIADTAGIRDTTDQIEKEGVRRARRVQAEADLVLMIIDCSVIDDEPLVLLGRPDPATTLLDSRKTIVVCNKSDLPAKLDSDTVCQQLEQLNECSGGGGAHGDEPVVLGPVMISALTGEGLDHLRSTIAAAMGAEEQSDGLFSARQRHVDALKRVGDHLALAVGHLEQGFGELIAEELRLGQLALSEITGEVLPDVLLGQIFASFCIGK
jgi:tRNA modification GTPase